MSEDPFKVIWTASAQRTGSSWADHVARQVLAIGRYKLVGPGRGVDPRSVPAFARTVIAQDKPRVIACLKTHLALKLDIPRTRFIVTYRDVRDSMLSLMRVSRGTFEDVLQDVHVMMRLTDHYLQASDDVALKIRYDEITVTPAPTVARMAKFLEVSCPPEAVTKIVDALDRDRLASRLARFEEAVRAKVAAGEEVPQWAVIKNYDGTNRFIDWNSGFQTGHVTSQRDGEWREVLTAQQQERLLGLTEGWLRRYGFAV